MVSKNLVFRFALVALLAGGASCSSPMAMSDGGSGGGTSMGGGGGGGGGAGAGGATDGEPDGATDAAAGSSDGPAGPEAGAPAAVRIIRGDPNETMWATFVIEGYGLTSDEGRLVTARLGMPDRPPERLAAGQARVENGAFRLEFPQGCEAFLYKQKVLFVDVDGDGICTPAVDRVYSDFRFLTGDLTVTLSDSVPAPPANLAIWPTSTATAAGSCEVLNQPWPDF